MAIWIVIDYDYDVPECMKMHTPTRTAHLVGLDKQTDGQTDRQTDSLPDRPADKWICQRQLYIKVPVNTCTCVCVRVFFNLHTVFCMYKQIHVCIHTLHPSVHAYIHTYIHICIDTYIHAYIPTYTCIPRGGRKTEKERERRR